MNEIRSRFVALLPESLAARVPEGEAFREWVSTAPDEAAEMLAALEASSLEKAARALAEIGSAAVPVLMGAESRITGKHARKALRRALHSLRSRGIVVEETRTPETGRLPPTKRDEAEAFVGPIDPQGRRFLVLLLPARPTARLYQVLSSDEEGILRVELAEAKRKEARGWVREIRKRSGGVLVEASADEVRALLGRMLRIGVVEPSPGVRDLEAELASDASDLPTPGERIRERLAEPPISDAVASLDLRQRFERGDIAPWLLRAEDGSEGLSDLESAQDSPLVLSGVQKEERRRAGLARLSGQLLDAETRERISVRLEETAYLLNQKGDREGARAAVGVAARIRLEKRPEEIEFLRMLLELSLQEMRQARKAEGAGKLIIPG
jgi:hypothetical protein